MTESPTMAILGKKDKAPAKSKTTTQAKPKADKPVSKKAKSKKNTKPANDMAGDYLVQVVQSIEKMGAAELMLKAQEMAEGVEKDYFTLGGMLDRIHSEDLFRQKGYEEFGDYVFDVFGFKRSKALFLIQIYNKLIEAEVKWADAKDVQWCKLRLLTQVINKKSAPKWLAAARKVSVTQLAQYIKDYKAKKAAEAGEGEGPDEPKTTTTMSFKLKADQYDMVNDTIEKVKTEADTKSKEHALFLVCTSFMSGGKPIKVTSKDPVVILRAMDVTKAAEALNEAHPNTHVTVVAPE